MALSEGKRGFDFLCSEYRQMFGTPEWWGFRQLWDDWKGNRWLLGHLCSWYGELPNWLMREDLSGIELDTLLAGEMANGGGQGDSE